jgi:hypothetical protein
MRRRAIGRRVFDLRVINITFEGGCQDGSVWFGSLLLDRVGITFKRTWTLDGTYRQT